MHPNTDDWYEQVRTGIGYRYIHHFYTLVILVHQWHITDDRLWGNYSCIFGRGSARDRVCLWNSIVDNQWILWILSISDYVSRFANWQIRFSNKIFLEEGGQFATHTHAPAKLLRFAVNKHFLYCLFHTFRFKNFLHMHYYCVRSHYLFFNLYIYIYAFRSTPSVWYFLHDIFPRSYAAVVLFIISFLSLSIYIWTHSWPF